MSNAIYFVPPATNEPCLNYAPGSPEKKEVKAVLKKLMSQKIDVPMIIGGKEVRTKDVHNLTPPHDHKKVVGTYSRGNKRHVQRAIDAALKAKAEWEAMPWHDRAAIFLRAAELITGPYRAEMNAYTMIAQSKNIWQAEIDAVCEMADFFRFNVQYMTEVYEQQPESGPGIWNRLEYRPLEGFVFALTPFNFTSIAANLPFAPALMGNTVVWKPADSQIYSAHFIMEIFRKAGLPDGVINLVFVSGPEAGDVIFSHPDFAGLHFTGSTGVFNHLWRTIGNNLDTYKSYPRIVGETGGKDFVVAHPSADPQEVITALSRGAFEFQGQKCSAASRAYIPKSMWDEVKKGLVKDVKSFKMGSPDDFTNFINAVIDERAYDKITDYIKYAKESKQAEIIVGGKYSKKEGYFISPTVIQAKRADFKTMREEIFGPVLTIYVYSDSRFNQLLTTIE